MVALEPLKARHEEGLLAASQHPEIWQWLAPIGESREYFSAWFAASLADSQAGREGVFATVDRGSGKPIGSTRYLSLREAHRGLEIGWTWLAPSAWRTGANVEAKLLMLEHAFERLGCVRVEFKTDVRNERSRAALAALPAQFEGVPSSTHDHAGHRQAGFGLLQRHRRRLAAGACEPRAPVGRGARGAQGRGSPAVIVSARLRA